MAQTIWGIRKEFLVGAVILLALVVPVVPRQKAIQVTDTVMVTQTLYSTNYVTSTVSTTSAIQVYVGYLTSGSNTPYCYWDYYYGWLCGSNYYSYGSKITVDPQDHITKWDQTPQSDGSYTITLYTHEGQQRVYRDISNWDLTLTATANVSGTAQVTNPVSTPYTQVTPQQQTHTEFVTERVSILQLLLGY